MPISKAYPTGPTKMTVAPAATKDLGSGMRRLRGAFLEAESRSAEAGAMVISPDQSDPPAFLIGRGFAYSATILADGRRAITDIHLPGDIVGVETVVMGRTNHAVVAANNLHFRPLSANSAPDGRSTRRNEHPGTRGRIAPPSRSAHGRTHTVGCPRTLVRIFAWYLSTPTAA
jgi:hypothetical protein